MANFQRRHYEAIVQTVAKLGNPDCRMDIAMLLADMFLQDNKQFEPSKFLDACNVYPKEPMQRTVRRGVVP